MPGVVLFVDGENFRHKVEEAVSLEGIDKNSLDFAGIEMNSLFNGALAEVKPDKKVYYLAKIHEYKDTAKKSRELILLQRRLKTNLEKQGFEVVVAGHVRGQEVGEGKSKKLVFREKGVDVRMAVDLAVGACDKVMDTAIVCSSDSDLQPAVKEAQKRQVKVVYLGFQNNPNVGLTHTTNQTILFRNSEIIKSFPKKS